MKWPTRRRPCDTCTQVYADQAARVDQLTAELATVRRLLDAAHTECGLLKAQLAKACDDVALRSRVTALTAQNSELTRDLRQAVDQLAKAEEQLAKTQTSAYPAGAAPTYPLAAKREIDQLRRNLAAMEAALADARANRWPIRQGGAR